MPDRTGSLWRNADFLKLWSGQSVSELGSQITMLAAPLTAVIVLHATAFEVGALNATEMAPFLLIGLPAGAVVDRLRKRRVLIVSDVLRMLAFGSIPIAAAYGALGLAQLYAVTFIGGILTVFFDVSYQSYLPALVSHDQLTDGNAKLTATSQLAAVAGPAASGALVSAVGAATAIAADAASYLISVVSIIWIRRPDLTPDRDDAGGFGGLTADTKEGFRFVFRHPVLRWIAATTGWGNLATDISFAVMTVYMVRRLHLSPAHIGLLFAIGSVAGLAGAVVATRVIALVGVGWTVITGAIGSSLGGIGLAMATRGAGTWWIAVGMATFWVFAVIYNIAQVSLRQAITPARLLGRMNATMRFMVWGPAPIGALIGGALGTTIGLRPTLWVAAGTGLIAPLFVAFSPIRYQRDIPTTDEPPSFVPSPTGPAPIAPPPTPSPTGPAPIAPPPIAPPPIAPPPTVGDDTAI